MLSAKQRPANAQMVSDVLLSSAPTLLSAHYGVCGVGVMDKRKSNRNRSSCLEDAVYFSEFQMLTK